MCSSQLCEIDIYKTDIWKVSDIVPVPKNYKVGRMNDLILVALTSVAFKTGERIVLPQHRPFIHD